MLSNGQGMQHVICAMWKLKYGYGWGSISISVKMKNVADRKSLIQASHWNMKMGSEGFDIEMKVGRLRKCQKVKVGGCGIRRSRLKEWKSCRSNLLLRKLTMKEIGVLKTWNSWDRRTGDWVVLIKVGLFGESEIRIGEGGAWGWLWNWSHLEDVCLVPPLRCRIVREVEEMEEEERMEGTEGAEQCDTKMLETCKIIGSAEFNFLHPS